MSFQFGQALYYHGTRSLFLKGIFQRMHGPKLAVVQITASITSQNFLTGKVTTDTIRRKEYWPVNKVSTTPPPPEPEPADSVD